MLSYAIVTILIENKILTREQAVSGLRTLCAALPEDAGNKPHKIVLMSAADRLENIAVKNQRPVFEVIQGGLKADLEGDLGE